MASFKVSKKNAISDTRTNVIYLHEKKLSEFEQEKKTSNKSELQKI